MVMVSNLKASRVFAGIFRCPSRHGRLPVGHRLLEGCTHLQTSTLAWTSVCKTQMQDLEKHKEHFDRLDAVALGLSVDSVPCKRAWAEAIGVKDTSLLADFWPHGGVAQAYGIFREKNGFSERAVFIVDREGGDPLQEDIPNQGSAGHRGNPQGAGGLLERRPICRALQGQFRQVR